ncbi:MAG: hypothetical protein HYW07_01610 [Candidatus Latescibacteria bacterium]|nr:hypothetical protein [Candidatus Latescibacterota bacterium]
MAQENRTTQGTALQVQEGQVVIGSWTEDLMQVVAQSAQLRGLLRAGRTEEARAFLQARRAEEQAALVAFDVNPEEVLALTGMDAQGKPGYQTAVVDLLPTEILTSLIAPRLEEERFNVEVLRALSPDAFARTVEETLDPVYQQELRTQVSWEWLEAVAELVDPGKAAALLRQVDPEMLEDAILDRLEALDLNALFSANGATVYVFQLFSESGGGLALPLIDDPEADPETVAVIQALYEAAPDLLAAVVRKAWERAEGGEA